MISTHGNVLRNTIINIKKHVDFKLTFYEKFYISTVEDVNNAYRDKINKNFEKYNNT